MLPETMAQFLPLVDEMIILDLGSTDGTAEFLVEVAAYNSKVKPIFRENFPFSDASVFASLANELVELCQHDRVIYWQADEIWHENLLHLMARQFDAGFFDLSFWRVQFRENFQKVKWFPHLVHRVGLKGAIITEGKNNFEFDGDGMNTTRSWDAPICSNFGGEMFPKWDSLGQQGIKPYVSEMITDVSLVGGFLENIPERRRMHAPFWHEEPDIEGQPSSEWMERQRQNNNWYLTMSPYNLPNILKYHVGRTKYELRPELLEVLKQDDTRELVGL